ncbi:MAG: DUF5666 domain-containing protein [Rhodoferax sp.]|nr:DUF5666 domain-containing protein [Rhodoferax sp.]
MSSNLLKSLIAVLAIPIISACGGSGSPPPSVTTQTTVGTITAFGSVVVNGIRFDDSTARITMDDALTTRDRLRLGMVVQVRGQINANGTGAASSIQYNDCVQGPITAMNQVQNTVTVLGQTVHIDDSTVFDGVTLRDMNSFAVGDQVEISCLRDQARSQIRATRMERQGAFQNGVSELEVKGTVANLNLAAGTCTIDGLVVNFSGVAAANRPNGLINGMTVEAGGRNLANGVLLAEQLRDRDRDRISYPDGEGLEVEGYVSDFVSIANFKVAGQLVNGANAVIRNGTVADIANGVKVEADGTVSNGVLVASVLVLKLQTSVSVEAGMQSKDTAANTITLLGRAIKVNVDTEWRDRLASPRQPTVISLAALNPADRLEVKAYKDANGTLVATRVERTEADTLVVVKGPADAKVPATQLTISGIGVATGANTRYRDLIGVLVDATTFYSSVQVPPALPTIVHARGVVANLATNVVDATRAVSSIGELEISKD